MSLRNNKDLASDGIRYFVAGLVNTALSVGIYQVCLFFLSPALSYAVAWCVGIIIVAVLYPRLVYIGASAHSANSLKTAAVYITTFIAGLGIVQVGAGLGLERLAIVASLLCTSILNFVLVRQWVRR